MIGLIYLFFVFVLFVLFSIWDRNKSGSIYFVFVGLVGLVGGVLGIEVERIENWTGGVREELSINYPKNLALDLCIFFYSFFNYHSYLPKYSSTSLTIPSQPINQRLQSGFPIGC